MHCQATPYADHRSRPHRLIALRVALSLLTFSLLAGCAGAPHKPAPQATPGQIADQALSDLRAGRTQTALALIGQSLKTQPKSASLWRTLGLTLARMDKNRAADKAFQRALRLAPGNGGIHNDYGVFLCREQFYAKARSEFHAAIHNPRYGTPQIAWTNFGICALREGKPALAHQGFTQALANTPNFAPALYQMAKLEASHGKPQQAATYLARLNRSGAQTPQSLSLCMSVYKDINKYKLASECARQLYQQFPDSPQARALIE